MACEDAAQQAHGGAGVSCVEISPGFVKPPKALADDLYRAILGFRVRAQARKAIESAAAIGGGGIVFETARAIGQRGENRVAMGDGFIAGEGYGAGSAFGGSDDAIGHAAILANGARRQPAEVMTASHRRIEGDISQRRETYN